MKVLKEDCDVALKIRRVEQLLRNEGIDIDHRGDGILIHFQGKSFVIREGESGRLIPTFPSECDGTSIQYIEHYINGE